MEFRILKTTEFYLINQNFSIASFRRATSNYEYDSNILSVITIRLEAPDGELLTMCDRKKACRCN